MAAPAAYRFKSLVVATVSKPTVIDASVTESNQGVSEHRTDNDQYVRAVFVDGLKATCKVVTTDSQTWKNGDKLTAVVLTEELRSTGTGATASYRIATMAVAVVTGGPTVGMPIAGRGTWEYELTAVSDDGTTAPVVWS